MSLPPFRLCFPRGGLILAWLPKLKVIIQHQNPFLYLLENTYNNRESETNCKNSFPTEMRRQRQFFYFKMLPKWLKFSRSIEKIALRAIWAGLKWQSNGRFQKTPALTGYLNTELKPYHPEASNWRHHAPH